MVAFVINKKGMVLIKDELFQFILEGTKRVKYSNVNDVHKVSHLKTIQFTTFVNGNIFDQDAGEIIWYYDSPNHRFKHYVYFKSCIVTYTNMSSIFYTEAIAERKRWGK